MWRRRRHDDEVPVTQATPCGNGVETSGDTSAAGVTSPLFLPNCLYPVATYHGTTDEVFPVHTGHRPYPQNRVHDDGGPDSDPPVLRARFFNFLGSIRAVVSGSQEIGPASYRYVTELVTLRGINRKRL